MLDVSGVYGANVPQWPERLWHLIGLGGFKWVVVRTDCDPSVAHRLWDLGFEVIMQMPDGFNQEYHRNPAAWVAQCCMAANKFRRYSHIICLDNEPNLCQAGDSRWFAEQFCRWYRAVIALWRYHDPGGHWKVLFPALSPTQTLLPLPWLEINAENIRESDALAAHSYWPGSHPQGLTFQDALYRQMHYLYSDKDIYILEYGSPSTTVTDADKANGYNWFLTNLPAYVKCGCLFILGGTPEWHDWFLTKEIAGRLGIP